MRAELRVFSDFMNNSTTCTFIGDTFETEIFDERIDPEKATSVNYYRVEGRTATFSIPPDTAVHNLLRNRRLYKHAISRELTRIAVKIYNDNDDVVFFGVVKYTYTYDKFSNIIKGITACDMILIIAKYWQPFFSERVNTGEQYILNDAIEFTLGTDENSPKRLDAYFPFGINFSYLFEIDYFGFNAEQILVSDLRDVFYNDGQALYPGEEEIGLFGIYSDVDIENGQDLQLHRIVSLGFKVIENRLDLTAMFYEYRNQQNPSPDGTTDYFGREKINMKTFLFTPGGQYQITNDIAISRNPTKDYSEYVDDGDRLIDTEFFGRGYEVKKEWTTVFQNDTYNITALMTEVNYVGGSFWNLYFTGTAAQDLIEFSSSDKISMKNALSGCLLINNMTILQDVSQDNLVLNIVNKLKTQENEPIHYATDSNSRIIETDLSGATYNNSLLDQFIFGVDIRGIIEEYYSNLFNKYSIKAEIIIPRKSTLKIGDTIQYDGKSYVIMELDRNYQSTFYKATCYGEE